MCCIFCHKNVVITTNPRTQARKGLISYYETNGTIFKKKHVDVDHMFIAKKFAKKNEQFNETNRRKTSCKKKGNITRRSILKFL